MDLRHYPCVSCRTAGETGAAAVASYHGLPVTLDELRQLIEADALDLDEGRLLVAARQLGFETVSLAGEYADLPEVPRPNLVSLSVPGPHEARKDRYAVLYEIDATGVVVADPLVGATERRSQEDFCAAWTGACVQITPTPEIEETKTRLDLLRHPWQRLAHAIWSPPYGRKAVLGIGALAAATAAVLAAQRLGAVALLAVLARHRTACPGCVLTAGAGGGRASAGAWLGRAASAVRDPPSRSGGRSRAAGRGGQIPRAAGRDRGGARRVDGRPWRPGWNPPDRRRYATRRPDGRPGQPTAATNVAWLSRAVSVRLPGSLLRESGSFRHNVAALCQPRPAAWGTVAPPPAAPTGRP